MIVLRNKVIDDGFLTCPFVLTGKDLNEQGKYNDVYPRFSWKLLIDEKPLLARLGFERGWVYVGEGF